MKSQPSIKLIQEFEQDKPAHVAFSGGKDSIVMYDLVKRSGIPHQAYFAVSTVDPPELTRFIRTFYPEVIFLRPEFSMYQLIIKKGLPIRSRNKSGGRFCCEYLKEFAGKGEFCIMGIRWAESANRKRSRNYFELDSRKRMQGKMYLNPIIDWSDIDVWDYIHVRGLPYPELYDCGFTRIGCIGCPNAYYKTRQRELNRYPRFKRMYLKAIRKRMELGFFPQFKDEYDVYTWWVGNKSMKSFLSQYRLPYDNSLISN